MKNTIRLLLAGVVAVLLFSPGCKKSETATGPAGSGSASGTASFTLDGAGVSNQTFSMSNVSGFFSTNDNATSIVGVGVSGADTINMVIAFPGSTTGTFQFDVSSAGMVLINSSGIMTSGTGNGQIAVTAFGAVGGSVTGTFSGRLYELDLSMGIVDSAQVSNGSFNATRLPNQ